MKNRNLDNLVKLAIICEKKLGSKLAIEMMRKSFKMGNVNHCKQLECMHQFYCYLQSKRK